jgi:hypothetical protein
MLYVIYWATLKYNDNLGWCTYYIYVCLSEITPLFFFFLLRGMRDMREMRAARAQSSYFALAEVATPCLTPVLSRFALVLARDGCTAPIARGAHTDPHNLCPFSQ